MCARLLHGSAFVLAVLATVLTARAADAQETVRAPMLAAPAIWRVGITTGVLTEPMDVGQAGGALTAEIARRLGASRVSLVGLFIAARHSDVGTPGPNRFVYDRDWRIAALGVEKNALRTTRLDLALGLQGAVLWSRMRRVGSVGTPVPPGFPDPGAAPPTWDEGLAVVPSAHAAYRISGPLALSARLAVIQRVLQDEPLGDTGALLSVGAAIAW